MKTIKTNLVIIGATLTGRMAAVTAAENNLDIFFCDPLKPREDIDFDGIFGMFAVESSFQKGLSYKYTCKEAFEEFMRHTNWQTDAQLTSAFIRESASFLKYFVERGLSIENVYGYFEGAPLIWHMPPEPLFANRNLNDILEDELKKHNIAPAYEMTIEELILTDGKVCGIRTADAAGQRCEILADAVILATDGTHTWMGGPSEYGLNLGRQAGAGLFAPRSHTSLDIKFREGQQKGFAYPNLFRQPNLMVNINGERYYNEQYFINWGITTKATLATGSPYAFMIFDQSAVDYYAANGYDLRMHGNMEDDHTQLPSTLEPMLGFADDPLFTAASIDELAAKTGIDQTQLAETVREYNEICQSGFDHELYKDHAYLKPVLKAPFYAVKYTAELNEWRVLNVNRHGQVRSESGRPIPGFYACGPVADNIEGDCYPYSMAGHYFAIGLYCAKAAVEHALKHI